MIKTKCYVKSMYTKKFEDNIPNLCIRLATVDGNSYKIRISRVAIIDSSGKNIGLLFPSGAASMKTTVGSPDKYKDVPLITLPLKDTEFESIQTGKGVKLYLQVEDDKSSELLYKLPYDAIDEHY